MCDNWQLSINKSVYFPFRFNTKIVELEINFYAPRALSRFIKLSFPFFSHDLRHFLRLRFLRYEVLILLPIRHKTSPSSWQMILRNVFSRRDIKYLRKNVSLNILMHAFLTLIIKDSLRSTVVSLKVHEEKENQPLGTGSEFHIAIKNKSKQKLKRSCWFEIGKNPRQIKHFMMLLRIYLWHRSRAYVSLLFYVAMIYA